MYAWIAQNRSDESISLCCRTLSANPNDYHRHLRRGHVDDRNAPLLSELREIHRLHPEYGVERKRRVLSVECSYGKAYALCKANGLMQKALRKTHSLTKVDPKATLSEDLVQRDFSAAAPSQKWLGDITQIRCEDGKLYICGILDCFDGAVVGLSMADHMRAELCTQALEAATGRFSRSDGLIFHSDRGSQYTSRNYREALAKHGILQSMGRTGSCFDNARMESFWASLKKDLLYRLPLSQMTKQQVSRAIWRWTECHYHWERPYSANPDWMPPLRYREAWRASATIAA